MTFWSRSCSMVLEVLGRSKWKSKENLLKRKHKALFGSLTGRFKRCPQISVLRLTGVIGQGNVGRRNGLTLADLESSIEAALKFQDLRQLRLALTLQEVLQFSQR